MARKQNGRFVKYSIRFLSLFCSVLVAVGCVSLVNPPAQNMPQEVVVFAAASLTEALTAAGERFGEAGPQRPPLFNFAGSQQLANQLVQGAQADIFVSADQRQMDEVVRAGLIDPSAVSLFACNRLVVVTSGQAVDSLAKLAAPGVKIVVGADVVPVGAYTQNFLAAAAADPLYGEGYRAGFLANVVSYEQSVRAVLSKVRLGEADAGIVYATDAQSVADVGLLEIPAHLNQLATYEIGPLLGGHSPELARQFLDFLRTPESRTLLTEAGFVLDCAVPGQQTRP